MLSRLIAALLAQLFSLLAALWSGMLCTLTQTCCWHYNLYVQPQHLMHILESHVSRKGVLLTDSSRNSIGDWFVNNIQQAVSYVAEIRATSYTITSSHSFQPCKCLWERYKSLTCFITSACSLSICRACHMKLLSFENPCCVRTPTLTRPPCMLKLMWSRCITSPVWCQDFGLLQHWWVFQPKPWAESCLGLANTTDHKRIPTAHQKRLDSVSDPLYIITCKRIWYLKLYPSTLCFLKQTIAIDQRPCGLVKTEWLPTCIMPADSLISCDWPRM